MSEISIDLEKLKADMTAAVSQTSGREFSLRVTNGRNASFYRNFIDGKDKRISADVFMGVVTALGRDPIDYVIGMKPVETSFNSTVLTSTFALLLDSIGVDPYENDRAQTLASKFPEVLKTMMAMRDG